MYDFVVPAKTWSPSIIDDMVDVACKHVSHFSLPNMIVPICTDYICCKTKKSVYFTHEAKRNLAILGNAVSLTPRCLVTNGIVESIVSYDKKCEHYSLFYIDRRSGLLCININISTLKKLFPVISSICNPLHEFHIIPQVLEHKKQRAYSTFKTRVNKQTNYISTETCKNVSPCTDMYGSTELTKNTLSIPESLKHYFAHQQQWSKELRSTCLTSAHTQEYNKKKCTIRNAISEKALQNKKTDTFVETNKGKHVSRKRKSDCIQHPQNDTHLPSSVSKKVKSASLDTNGVINNNASTTTDKRSFTKKRKCVKRNTKKQANTFAETCKQNNNVKGAISNSEFIIKTVPSKTKKDTERRKAKRKRKLSSPTCNKTECVKMQKLDNKENNVMSNTHTKDPNSDKEEELLSLRMKKAIDKYHNMRSCGPIHICICCDQLHYKESVINALFLYDICNKAVQTCIKMPIANDAKLCKTCRKYLRKDEIPPASIANGNAFKDIPAALSDLNDLEWRLVSPRIHFAKIFQAPRGKQYKILGNVVNVPVNVNNTLTHLPRRGDEMETIKVQLKRRLSHRNIVLSKVIRPRKVREAAKWLIKNGSLYRNKKIRFDKTWSAADIRNENVCKNSASRKKIPLRIPMVHLIAKKITKKYVSMHVRNKHKVHFPSARESVEIVVPSTSDSHVTSKAERGRLHIRTQCRLKRSRSNSRISRKKHAAMLRNHIENVVTKIKHKYKKFLLHRKRGNNCYFANFRFAKKNKHLYRSLKGYVKQTNTQTSINDASKLSCDIVSQHVVHEVHKKCYVCTASNCNEIMYDYAFVKKHMLVSHDSEEEGENFLDLRHFYSYNQSHDLQVQTSYRCGICLAYRNTNDELAKHMCEEHDLLHTSAALAFHNNNIGDGLYAYNIINNDETHPLIIYQNYIRPNITFRVEVAVPVHILPASNTSSDVPVQSLLKNVPKTGRLAVEIEVRENTPGCSTTMVTGPDFLESDERHKVLSVAPGEGSIPLSLVGDTFNEELGFPNIFLGDARPHNDERYRPIYFSELCKSELRRSDRRVASNIDNIFYKVKKMQMKSLLAAPTLALRKHKAVTKINAGNLRNAAYVESLVRKNEGYTFLKNLRGSPPYFQQAKKDLFAMIRQLGPATLFCSFSSAETKWVHLIRILGKVVDNKDYTDSEIKEMSWDKICELIQKEPVTCARHFDYSLRKFISSFLLGKEHPIGEIADYFYRVEQQSRGSCHAHFIIWIKDAPRYGYDSNEDVIKFIDKIITCEKVANDSPLATLVARQYHNHSRTCLKRNKECRFHYPQPPLLETCILTPLDIEMPDIKTHKDRWQRLYHAMNAMKEGEDISFEAFLAKLDVTFDDYILAIRSSLKSDTIFLKRKPCEIRINNYNKYCLAAWEANMDIQYITDIYSCAMYVVSYVSKASRGISELLHATCKEVQDGNHSLREQFRIIGNKFINGVEISAQEAIYLLLGLCLRFASRTTVFIPTAPPNERTELLKNREQLSNMEDDDEDVKCGNLLKRYAERPAEFGNMCLADWAAWYDTTTYKPKRKDSKTELDEEGFIRETEPIANEDNVDEMNSAQNTLPKKRAKARVIRAVWYQPNVDEEKYCREMLMLFVPWRDELNDMMEHFPSFKARFNHFKDQIEDKLNFFSPNHVAFNEMLQNIQNQDEEEADMTHLAPNIQQQDDDDIFDGLQMPRPQFDTNYDIGLEMGMGTSLVREEELVRFREINDTDFRAMVRQLNREQRQIFDHILHTVKTDGEQMCTFITGGAGVGKSFLIKTLYQALLKHYNSIPGTDFNELRILLMAPTGKAAYNIKGNTIHSALNISIYKEKRSLPLTTDVLTALKAKIGSTKVVIIDEISMVGASLFQIVDSRLKQLMRNDRPFGGVHVLAIGDLFQLQPVGDSWVFNLPDAMYNALAPNIWVDNFRCFELKTIMRQKDDKKFACLLNRLRENRHTTDDIRILSKRIIKQTDAAYSVRIPHAFYTNDQVSDFNDSIYNQAETEKHILHCVDTVLGGHPKDLVQAIIQSIPVKTRYTMSLEKEIKIAVGHAAEVTLNIATEDGLVNGAPCIVKHVQYTQGVHPIPYIVWVYFHNSDTGRKTRYENSRFYGPDIEHEWTPIFAVCRQFKVRLRSAEIQRKQFPLKAAHARTIHKLQGATLEELVCELPGRRVPHIHYVALSRITSMDKLHILKLNPKKINVDERVVVEMRRLRRCAKLQIPQTMFYNMDKKYVKMLFLNVTSLHKHMEDVRADYNVNSADICVFCETRAMRSDSDNMYKLGGFTSFFNYAETHSEKTRTPYGTTLYSKKQLGDSYPSYINKYGLEITVFELSTRANTIFICVYRSPKYKLGLLCCELDKILKGITKGTNICIMGDFNVDWHDILCTNALYTLLCVKYNLEQHIRQSTTNNLTCIDHIYTNFPPRNIQTGVFETYYTHHKAVWIAL
jgi:hypothetical protein